MKTKTLPSPVTNGGGICSSRRLRFSREISNVQLSKLRREMHTTIEVVRATPAEHKVW